ncbi:MAG TPA: 3-dehydroquinate synthase family protein, partial [Gammaproteobacteria bacterium]
MKRIAIRHLSGEYAVIIGAGVLDAPLLPELAGQRPALIVTDEHLASHWLDHLRRRLPAAATLVLPAGEAAKTLQTVERIWSMLAKQGFGRDAVLVALGGGVIGDLTGYAAACWMRGVDVIQVPTSLLAQVDASIGGKTGVDLPAGKNLVGAFHQPRAVLIDTRVLETLPQREYSAGLAEIVKAALLADAGFLDWLEGNADALRARDGTAIEYAIHRSCEIKAAFVMTD